VTVLPDKNDTVTIKSTRYEQPAFSSFSMYQDIKTDLAWRHKFNEQFSTQLGFTLYVGDWEQPINRDDWIYTPSAALDYNFNKHWSAELAGSYDWTDSKVSDTVEKYTSSHEFTRELVSLSVKYVF
jgi:long-subunit fatty acid transport protein